MTRDQMFEALVLARLSGYANSLAGAACELAEELGFHIDYTAAAEAYADARGPSVCVLANAFEAPDSTVYSFSEVWVLVDMLLTVSNGAEGDGFPAGLTPEQCGGEVVDVQTLGMGHLPDLTPPAPHRPGRLRAPGLGALKG